MELSTGLVRQQRKASSQKSPCRKHNTWFCSQGNLMGYNMASQYTDKSARFLCNCNALWEELSVYLEEFPVCLEDTMNWICLCAGMQVPTNPISCILACRSLSAVLIVTEVMVKVQITRNESPETWSRILYIVFKIAGCIALHFLGTPPFTTSKTCTIYKPLQNGLKM